VIVLIFMALKNFHCSYYLNIYAVIAPYVSYVSVNAVCCVTRGNNEWLCTYECFIAIFCYLCCSYELLSQNKHFVVFTDVILY